MTDDVEVTPLAPDELAAVNAVFDSIAALIARRCADLLGGEHAKALADDPGVEFVATVALKGGAVRIQISEPPAPLATLCEVRVSRDVQRAH